MLVEACPFDLGYEIAVTGSAARGMADEFSDVEINVWGDRVPDERAWRDWLEGSDATDISFTFAGDADWTCFRWVVCRVDGIWVEAGFALIDEFDAFVGNLVAGQYTDHLRLQMGWMIEQAIPLQTEGRLAAWKGRVARYPDGLAERIVAEQTAAWSDPHVPGVRWGLAARGERLGLALRLTWDMQNLLRTLFAVNRVWERDLKWTNERALDFPIKPSDLSARIDAVFDLTDPGRAVEADQRLIVETLELAEGQGFEVSAALRSVEDGLRMGLEAHVYD